MPSALRLLVGRQEGWWGAGMVICLEQGAETCIWPNWCQCHSLSLASVKSILVLPFWYRLTRVVLDKGPLNGCVCVRYTIIMWIIHGYIHMYYILFLKKPAMQAQTWDGDKNMYNRCQEGYFDVRYQQMPKFEPSVNCRHSQTATCCVYWMHLWPLLFLSGVGHTR